VSLENNTPYLLVPLDQVYQVFVDETLVVFLLIKDIDPLDTHSMVLIEQNLSEVELEIYQIPSFITVEYEEGTYLVF